MYVCMYACMHVCMYVCIGESLCRIDRYSSEPNTKVYGNRSAILRFFFFSVGLRSPSDNLIESPDKSTNTANPFQISSARSMTCQFSSLL